CAVTVTGSGRPVAPVRARAAMVSRYPPLALPAISQPASIEASHSPSAAGWTAVALANGPVRGHLAQTGIRAMLSSGAAPPAAAAAACAGPALQPQPARPQVGPQMAPSSTASWIGAARPARNIRPRPSGPGPALRGSLTPNRSPSSGVSTATRTPHRDLRAVAMKPE